MKTLVATALALTLIGCILFGSVLWITSLADYHLDAIMDPKDGPISLEQMSLIKKGCAEFIDACRWLGVTIGALTFGWLCFALRVRSLHQKALSGAQTP